MFDTNTMGKREVQYVANSQNSLIFVELYQTYFDVLKLFHPALQTGEEQGLVCTWTEESPSNIKLPVCK